MFQARAVNGQPFVLGRIDGRDVTITVKVEESGTSSIETARLVAATLNEGTEVLARRGQVKLASGWDDFPNSPR